MRYIEFTQNIFKLNEKQKEEEGYVLYVLPERLQGKDVLEVYAVPFDNVEDSVDSWNAYDQELSDKLGLTKQELQDANAVVVAQISKARIREFSLLQDAKNYVTLSERQYKALEKFSGVLASTPHDLRISNRDLLELKASPQEYSQRFLAISPKGDFILSARENVKEGTELHATNDFRKFAEKSGWNLQNFKKTTDFEVYKESLGDDEE